MFSHPGWQDGAICRALPSPQKRSALQKDPAGGSLQRDRDAKKAAQMPIAQMYPRGIPDFTKKPFFSVNDCFAKSFPFFLCQCSVEPAHYVF